MIALHPPRGDRPARLVIDDEMTVVQAAEARTELLRLCQPLAQQPLDIDLADMTPVDTAGVQLLFALARSLRQQGTDARLVACHPSLQSMAAVLGADAGGQCCGLPLAASHGARA